MEDKKVKQYLNWVIDWKIPVKSKFSWRTILLIHNWLLDYFIWIHAKENGENYEHNKLGYINTERKQKYRDIRDKYWKQSYEEVNEIMKGDISLCDYLINNSINLLEFSGIWEKTIEEVKKVMIEIYQI